LWRLLIHLSSRSVPNRLCFGFVSSPGGDFTLDQSDLDYYRARIAEEEIAAQRATHPQAAESHKKLAEEYASLIVATEPVLTEKVDSR
jgi:hypothetical protein